MLEKIGSWASILSFLVTLIGIVLGVVAWIRRYAIRRWFKNNQFNPGRYAPTDMQIDGLIYIVSRSGLTIESLKILKPKYVGIIGSQDDKFREEARKVYNFAHDELKVNVYEPKLVDCVDLPEPTKNACIEMIRQMRKNKVRTIGVEVTGGKAPMSIGAFMAAEEMGVTSYYTATPHIDADTRQGESKLVILSEI